MLRIHFKRVFVVNMLLQKPCSLQEKIFLADIMFWTGGVS